MKVLILGTDGYIGSHLSYYFSKVKGAEIFHFNRNSINIKYLESLNFDYIFICIGNKNSRLTESESLITYDLDINFISLIKNIKYKKIIHISTILIDFTENNYTEYKIRIESYLKDNFENLVILRVCNLIGVNKIEIFKDLFYKNLNIVPKLFLYSKGVLENIDLEDNFLNNKKEYLDINDFSSYFSSLENIKLLENRVYRVGTEDSISGKDMLLKLSTVFNFDLNKINIIKSIESGFNINTNDLLLTSPDFENIYQNYTTQYNLKCKNI